MSGIVKWVVTPRCSECQTPMALKGRYCCLGCERQQIKKKYKKEKIKHITDKKAMSQRNLKIAGMRENGMSYGEIATILKIPRATVQSAAAAAKISLQRNQSVS